MGKLTLPITGIASMTLIHIFIHPITSIETGVIIIIVSLLTGVFAAWITGFIEK